ncbi:hypothetical protein RFF05_06665 [Bengtsoniella intestinalis]|uniref:hypothetical protein n=1 Tax=Bengtsoniella intestinalis TaxID=3073143 RepID=UPI00391EEA2D
MDIVLGNGNVGIATTSREGSKVANGIVLHQLEKPVLPIGTKVSDGGYPVEELVGTLVFIEFKNIEGAKTLQRAVDKAIKSMEGGVPVEL